MKKKGYLPGLMAGALVFAAGCGMGPKVEFLKGDSKIDIMIGEEHFTSYMYGNELTKPILYPVCAPSGIVVNRGYPFAKVEGESTDHPHHTGIFFTYDKVNDNGFWNNTTSPPQIKHIEVTRMKGKTGKGMLSTVMHWIGKNGQVLLEEKRCMAFLPGKDEYAIDFDITLTAQDAKVVFKDTKEGMFAIRAADWLREKGGTGSYLSSNGDQTEKNVWGKRAQWVRLQGEKDGKTVGIAILYHPSSVNYPTYWHARGYGLFSANPLGQYDFEKKQNPESAKPLNFTLEPGKTAHFRFRLIIYEGQRTQEQLEDRFKVFARSVKQ
ncbi:MAG TPA: PmoA family protein [Sedimentisphaerales bacterium]|nr:PmoA family protein [Sedimentisphaerales bacterium]